MVKNKKMDFIFYKVKIEQNNSEMDILEKQRKKKMDA